MIPVTKLTVSSLLRKAAEIISAFGLADGIRKDHTGAMCALGALDFVANGDPNSCKIDIDPILPKILAVLGLKMSAGDSGSAYPLARWSNDHSKRFVVEAFRKAANEAETAERNHSEVPEGFTS